MPRTTLTPPAPDLSRANWSHHDVTIRCAAARSAGACGVPDDVPFLFERALEDRSVAVRLAASTAAADVLSRHRSPGALTEAQVLGIWSLLRPVDPGRNPGLLQLCGELRLPDPTRRLFAALQDGRHDVRIGAIVGLHRHAASGWCDPALEDRVLSAASDRAVPADTRAALVRVCADVGWTQIAPVAEVLAASDLENVAAIAGAALDWVRTPQPVEGVWADTGRDAWEAGPPDSSTRPVWGFVRGDPRAVVVDAGGRPGWREVSTTSPSDDGLRDAVHTPTNPLRIRTLRLPVESALRTRVLLAGARVLVPASPDERVRFLDALVDAAFDDALDWLDPVLPSDATTLRARGRRALRDGNLTQARAIFQAAALLPRPPPDLPRWIAETDAALGAPTTPPRARKRTSRKDS